MFDLKKSIATRKPFIRYRDPSKSFEKPLINYSNLHQQVQNNIKQRKQKTNYTPFNSNYNFVPIKSEKFVQHDLTQNFNLLTRKI